MEFLPPTRQALIELATGIICHRLGGSPRPLVLPADPAIDQPAGCFVSLHRRQNHALRGCIGLLNTGNPLRQVLVQAAESVLADPRFAHQPVTLGEIPLLDMEITVLSPLRQAASPLDFDPSAQGIYLTIQGRSGLFLPQVARETGWSRQQLLARLCAEKMGLPELAWKNPGTVLHTFTVEVIGPQAMLLAKSE